MGSQRNGHCARSLSRTRPGEMGSLSGHDPGSPAFCLAGIGANDPSRALRVPSFRCDYGYARHTPGHAWAQHMETTGSLSRSCCHQPVALPCAHWLRSGQHHGHTGLCTVRAGRCTYAGMEGHGTRHGGNCTADLGAPGVRPARRFAAFRVPVCVNRYLAALDAAGFDRHPSERQYTCEGSNGGSSSGLLHLPLGKTHTQSSLRASLGLCVLSCAYGDSCSAYPLSDSSSGATRRPCG